MKKGRTAVDDREDNVRIQEFLDMIAPSVIKFETDHFICGNTYRCVWALREYPTATEEQAILSHLGEKDGVTLRIYTRHVTPVEERKIISNAANKNRMDRSNTSDLQQTVLAESNLQDVTTIVAQMHRNREPLLHTAVYLELCAHDLEHLKLLQTEDAQLKQGECYNPKKAIFDRATEEVNKQLKRQMILYKRRIKELELQIELLEEENQRLKENR